jgi:hypothetical protein
MGASFRELICEVESVDEGTGPAHAEGGDAVNHLE